jgi:hypothetical protein
MVVLRINPFIFSNDQSTINFAVGNTGIAVGFEVSDLDKHITVHISAVSKLNDVWEVKKEERKSYYMPIKTNHSLLKRCEKPYGAYQLNQRDGCESLKFGELFWGNEVLKVWCKKEGNRYKVFIKELIATPYCDEYFPNKQHTVDVEDKAYGVFSDGYDFFVDTQKSPDSLTYRVLMGKRKVRKEKLKKILNLFRIA